jgi:hypothetical protein
MSFEDGMDGSVILNAVFKYINTADVRWIELIYYDQ